MSTRAEESTFLYWRIGSFLFIILVLVLLRYLLKRWYNTKLASALAEQQETLEEQQREREELARIEARLMAAYRNPDESASVPSEEPPYDYETAIKCEILNSSDYFGLDLDEAPPSYLEYLEMLASKDITELGLAADTKVVQQEPELEAVDEVKVTKEAAEDASCPL